MSLLKGKSGAHSAAAPAREQINVPVRTAAKEKRSPLTVIKRILAFFGAGLGVFLLLVVGAILIVCKGPSENAEKIFVMSCNETSALKNVPRWFLSDEEVDSILYPEESSDSWTELGYKAVDGAGAQEVSVQVSTDNASDELELIDIKGSTYKGKLLIIHDPARVQVAMLDYFGDKGIYLTEFYEKYGAVAATNAGGFYDPGGFGEGGIPDGLTIRNGQIAYGDAYTWYVDVIGFDADHVLHVGNMYGYEALDAGIVNGVSFSAGPVLIQNGYKYENLGGGVNPRTCIGQRADGAVLLCVIEGRHPDSLGATYDDIADLMEEYGAVNAANLDGGSSSAMIYNGEQITKGSNIVGSRPMCTAIVVLAAQEDEQ